MNSCTQSPRGDKILLAKLMLISTHVGSQNRDTENICKMRLVKGSKNSSLKLANCKKWLSSDFSKKSHIFHLFHTLKDIFVIEMIYITHFTYLYNYFYLNIPNISKLLCNHQKLLAYSICL